MNYAELVKAASEARENAYAPYSLFKVGAALLTTKGTIYTGCNIENAAYSHTVCAERVALYKAVCSGDRSFAAIAIVTAADIPVPPCGACRQVMAEFSADMRIIMANTKGDIVISNISELLPMAFNSNHIWEDKNIG